MRNAQQVMGTMSAIVAVAVGGGCIPTFIFDDPSCGDATACDAGGDATAAKDSPATPTDAPADALQDDPWPAADTADEATDSSDEPPSDGAPPCPGGATRCGDRCVALRDDPSNCGACGNLCSVPGAAAVCVEGVCTATTCLAGLGDCDRDVGNGCETNLGTSAIHCGRCNHACNLPGARSMCVGGMCTFDGCEGGRADCDGDDANGCEADLSRDPAHCGRCGNVCGSGECAASACAPDQRSCAASGTPGCGLVQVTGGAFTIGNDALCGSGVPSATCGLYSAPELAGVSVSGFRLDAYEVTVARFRAFWRVRAGVLASVRARPIGYPGGAAIPWSGTAAAPVSAATVPLCNWSDEPIGREAHPINCVGWWLAQEFCVWDGGRLPTEAEWEYAARGRAAPESGLLAGRRFPWGDQVPTTGGGVAACDRALFAPCPGEDGAPTRRVGRFPSSAGLFDLAGNVAEWLADTYATATFRSGCWASRVDPLCTSTSDLQLIAGGAWVNDEVNLRSASRVAFSPAIPLNTVGFRCARSH